jgi:hypothetical protein
MACELTIDTGKMLAELVSDLFRLRCNLISDPGEMLGEPKVDARGLRGEASIDPGKILIDSAAKNGRMLTSLHQVTIETYAKSGHSLVKIGFDGIDPLFNPLLEYSPVSQQPLLDVPAQKQSKIADNHSDKTHNYFDLRWATNTSS